MEHGITVYPPWAAGEPWRAVFTENGQRRNRQAASEAGLAAKLEKVKERLAADAANMERPGADLIAHYLGPDRLPPGRQWSRKHADTQQRLCERLAAPVITAVTCQDIKVAQMQQIVNAAPTAKEGERLHWCLSALVTAGIRGGYLANPRLREVHWQALGRPVPGPEPRVQGETVLLSTGAPSIRPALPTATRSRTGWRPGRSRFAPKGRPALTHSASCSLRRRERTGGDRTSAAGSWRPRTGPRGTALMFPELCPISGDSTL
jgi:hypothetical protein